MGTGRRRVSEIAEIAEIARLKAVHKGFPWGLSDTAVMEGRLDLLMLMRQPFEHETDHAEVDLGLAGGGQKLIVAAHASVASDPGERPLDDPPPRGS